MTKIIGIYSLTKNVGKTVSAAYLCEALANSNRNVLGIDLDTTKSLTNYVLSEKKSELSESLEFNKINHFSNSWDLLNVSHETNNKEIFNNYDFVIIDFPSSSSPETDELLTILDSVIIPVEAEYYGMDKIENTFEKILNVKNLLIEGILITKLDTNNNLSEKIIGNLYENFKELVFKTKISRNFYLGLPSFTINNLNNTQSQSGFSEYLNLAIEILENDGQE
jgi:chromosome partitioning protein